MVVVQQPHAKKHTAKAEIGPLNLTLGRNVSTLSGEMWQSTAATHSLHSTNACSGQIHCAAKGRSLVHCLFVLAFWHRICHQACSCLRRPGKFALDEVYRHTCPHPYHRSIMQPAREVCFRCEL